VKYLLDANAVIGLLAGNAGLLARVRQHVPEDFGVSAIAAHELFYGAYKSQRRAQNLARVDGLQFVVLEFDQEDARQAGEIRAALAAAGTPIGPYDVLIAGQARARSLILVTHNTGEFSRVSGLHVEDWQT
jgi:tRNA(fMet)-specific endonuclease VapC